MFHSVTILVLLLFLIHYVVSQSDSIPGFDVTAIKASDLQHDPANFTDMERRRAILGAAYRPDITGTASNQSLRLYITSDVTQQHIDTSGIIHMKGEELVMHAMLCLATSTMTGDCRISQQIGVHFTPKVYISNSTWTIKGDFKNVKVIQNGTEETMWQLKLKRTALTSGRRGSRAQEEWILRSRLILDDATVVEATYSLLDLDTEPLLQAVFSDLFRVQATALPVNFEMLFTQSPCAADVAIAFLKAPNLSEDVYIGVTNKAFSTGSTKWHHLKVQQFIESNFTRLQILDIVLTNVHLLVLTNEGIFTSSDLRYPQKRSFLPFKQFTAKNEICDRILQGKLTFNGICQSREHTHGEDFVTVVYQCQNMAEGKYYSNKDYLNWTEVYPSTNKIVLAALHNYHVDLLTILYKQGGTTYVAAHKVSENLTMREQPFYPPFKFDATVDVQDMIIHGESNAILIYGNGLWKSDDNGNRFYQLSKLQVSRIREMLMGKRDGKYFALFDGNDGRLLYGREGIRRVMQLRDVERTRYAHSVSSLISDYLGKVYWIDFVPPNVILQPLSIDTLVQEYLMDSDHPLIMQLLPKKQVIFYEYGIVPNARSFFSPNNVGQLLSVETNGSAILLEVWRGACGSFLSCVRGKIMEPFARHYSNILECDIEPRDWNHTTGEVWFHLRTSTQAVTCAHIWTDNELYTTLLIPTTSSFLLVERSRIANEMKAVAAIPIKGNLDTVRAGNWHLANLGMNATSGRSVWSVRESPCLHVLTSVDTERQSSTTIDYGETFVSSTVVKLTVAIVGLDNEIMHAHHSNPWAFRTKTITSTTVLPTFQQNFTVIISNVIRQTDATVLVVSLPMSSFRCATTAIMKTIFVGCPCGKRLIYLYPVFISMYDYLYGAPLDADNVSLLHTLSVNYRPPSSIGISVSTSDNIYHADPNIPRFDQFSMSKITGNYKQCEDKDNRDACNCSDEQKYSMDASVTDCKERVYKLIHPGDIQPVFKLQQPGKPDLDLSPELIITLRDVNDREPSITNMGKSTSKLLEKLEAKSESTGKYYNPRDVRIFMVGQGLYHFRARVMEELSLCDLYTDFQYFIYMTPMSYPQQYLVNFGVTFLFGTLLFLLFVLYRSNRQPAQHRFIGSRCQLVEDAVEAEGVHPPNRVYNTNFDADAPALTSRGRDPSITGKSVITTSKRTRDSMRSS